MKWYLCWAAESNFRTDHDWQNMIRTALYSAKVNTTLQPVIVIDGAPSPFTDELAAGGAQVIFHRLSFRDALEQHFAGQGPNLHIAIGTFLRFDIPLIEREAEYVLYTDCDVMFLRQPEFLAAEIPRYFAAAPQSNPNDPADMNAGVMLMNLRNMRALHGQLIEFTRANLHLGLDQEILRAAFATTFTHLRPILNWKPYWGLQPQAAILHWHGPKPVTIRKYLDDASFTSHPAWHELFHRDPQSYRQCERIYADFLLGAQADRQRDDTHILRIFAPEGEPFRGETIAHLHELDEIVRQSGAPPEDPIYHAGKAGPGFTDNQRNFAFFAGMGNTLLEIGFDAGQNALLALVANRNLAYLAVDSLAQPYSRPCFAYLRGVFGDRIKLFTGDPGTVVTQFSPDANRFLLASLGARRDLASMQADLAALWRIMPKGATILVNGCSHPPVHAAVLGAIARRQLRPLALPVLPTDQVFLQVRKP